MPIQKTKLIILTILSLAFFALSGEAQAAIFVDNDAHGCSNGSAKYSPATRACGSGSDTVYTTIENADISDGTQSNPRVINVRSGTTYSGEVNINSAWTTWQKYSGDASRPIIYGPGTAVRKDNAILNIKAVGVTIDNFEVHTDPNGIHGHGIDVKTGCHNATIKNCYIHKTGGSGIYAITSNNLLFENNDIYDAEYTHTIAHEEHRRDSWGGCIGTRTDCRNVTIRGNYIHNCGGEGMNISRKGENYLVENNTLCDTFSVGIFINQLKNVTVRNNLAYHTGNTRYKNGSAGGIVAAAERWHEGEGHYANYATDIDIYNNVVAGYTSSFAVSNVSTDYGYHVTNTRFYNNTAISTFSDGSSVSIVPRKGLTESPIGAGVEFKNNIFWQLTSSKPIVKLVGTATWDYNLWSSAPVAAARSSNDPRYYSTYGAINIAEYFTKGNWTQLQYGQLTKNDFRLLSTATHARDTGVALSSTYQTDIKGTTRPQNTKWDIGAYEYSGGGDPTPPSAPSRLSVR